MKHHHRAKSAREDCQRTRLAENDIGFVEICECGMWQLHVGAITLRLASCAVSELLGLLGSAVAESVALRLKELDPTVALPFARRERGEA